MQWNSETEAVWLAQANSELRSEVLALKQENERLRAAGNALTKWLWHGGGDLADMIAAVSAWEEARRG